MKINYKSSILAGILIAGFSLCVDTHQINYLKEFNDIEIKQQTNTKNTEIILKLLRENKQIGQTEKDFLCSFTDYYNEKSEYFDMNTIIPALKKLKIIYSNETDYQTLAFYNINKCEIVINNFDSFNEDVKRVLFHEYIHALTIKDPMNEKDALIFEGITESETTKYNNVEIRYYKLIINYITEIRKIVGDEVLQQYFYSGKEDIIIKSLDDIAMGRREAKELVREVYLLYNYAIRFDEENTLKSKENIDILLDAYKEEKELRKGEK